MRSTNATLLCALLVCSSLGAARADVGEDTPSRRRVVAVFPFSSPAPWSVMGRNAQATFVTQLVNARVTRVVDSTSVSKMLRRRGLHWTGVINPHLLRATGRWLKADYALVGKLRYTGDAYTLSVHLMNVRTLETTHAQDIDFRSAAQMRVAVRIAARKAAGMISGRGSRDEGNTETFLNVNARAFYDTAAAAIRTMGYLVNRFNFSGSVEEADGTTVKVKGYSGHLKVGVPVDIYSSDADIDEPKKVTTVYVTRVLSNGFDGKARFAPDDGIALGAKASNRKHNYVVAVGKIVDEAEDNKQLVTKFREKLLEKLSEGSRFQEIEGGATDWLAKLSNRRTRFFAFRKLFAQGVELVIEGKFYGTAGSRRAHFKIYSTATGKIWGEPKFETSL